VYILEDNYYNYDRGTDYLTYCVQIPKFLVQHEKDRSGIIRLFSPGITHCKIIPFGRRDAFRCQK
jgi:hypothetical protein